MAAVSLVGAIILSVLLYLLTGGTLLEQKARLYVFLPDATGLQRGSPVRVDGIGVGKVASIDLSGSANPARVVRVTMTVERDRLPRIPADSWSQLTSETLIGDKYVDITSGTSPAPVRGGAEIPYREPTAMMKRVDLRDFEKQLRAMDAVLSDIEQGRSLVGQFVLGDQFYTDLRRQLGGIEAAVKTVSDATGMVGGALYTDQIYRQIGEPFRDLDQTLARIQSGQGAAGRFFRDDAQYRQALAAMRDLRRSIGDLHSSEFMQSDRAYASWNVEIESLIRRVDDMNASPLLSNSMVYDNLNGFAREVRDSLKDFRENPKKYLRLKLF